LSRPGGWSSFVSHFIQGINGRLGFPGLPHFTPGAVLTQIRFLLLPPFWHMFSYSMSKVAFAYALALAGTVVWCALVVAAPYCAHLGGPWAPIGETIYVGFHRICHQLDGRSLHLFALPLAACSRCTAIYFAFLAGTVVYPFLRSLRTPQTPSRLTFILALMPMLIDVGLALSGIHESNQLSRLLTGTWFGAMLPFVVLPVYLGAVHEFSARSTSAHTHMKGTVDA